MEIVARSNRGTHHKSASAPRDDPAPEKNANGENAASGEIEPSRTSSFRQHRSSIERQKQQNGSCVSEWESWCDNASYNSASDTREHRANCSKNHLARVRIDCHLTHQNVERENCSSGNNQISADDRDNAAEGEKESVQHRQFYLIPRLWHRAIWPTLLSPLLRAVSPASHGTMGADSRDAVGAGVEVCGCVCGCASKADRPTSWSKLASASFIVPS